MEPTGIPHLPAESASEPGEVTAASEHGTPPDDPFPVEAMPTDHPLYGMDVDGLLQSDRSWMQGEFLLFYTECTRRSM